VVGTILLGRICFWAQNDRRGETRILVLLPTSHSHTKIDHRVFFHPIRTFFLKKQKKTEKKKKKNRKKKKKQKKVGTPP
jgi:hypothetical protein